MFVIRNGKGITKDEIENNPGNFTVVQSGEENNGVMGKIDKQYCIDNNYTVSDEPCLTIAGTGSAGFVSYQKYGCVVGNSAKVLELRNSDKISDNVMIFLQGILSTIRFKYSYGRKVSCDRYALETIKLPVTKNNLPDWQFMENYIKSLHYKPLTTKNKPGNALPLNVKAWKFFLLKDICKITMGNKMDLTVMTMGEPAVNFVGRSAANNGIAARVDIVYDKNGNAIEPYSAGCITVALGGSLGASYLQEKPFYTSQNVSVLEFDEHVPKGAKLFICALIENESKYKYFPFGRELNTHIRKDFGFTIPVDDIGLPNWQFMEDYIKSLHYGKII